MNSVVFNSFFIYFVVVISVSVNIVDEERRTSNSYDPQAPITRKGVLTCLRTKRPMEIKERDVVTESNLFVECISF